MKNKKTILLSLMFATIFVNTIFSATNYVWTGGTHQSPFTSWETAANDIQSAINAANTEKNERNEKIMFQLMPVKKGETNGWQILESVQLKSYKNKK